MHLDETCTLDKPTKTDNYRANHRNNKINLHESFINKYTSTKRALTIQSGNEKSFNELHYDEYLRNKFPQEYTGQNQSLIKEKQREQENHVQQQRDQFSSFFKTTAIQIKFDRERQYIQSKKRIQSSNKRKILQLNNYQNVDDDLAGFLKDHSWQWVKGRPKGYDFGQQNPVRKNLFDKKTFSNDERRFNNFNTKNFEIKIRVPQIDKYSARKPILNNMDTPSGYYEVQDVYQRITFGETMQKCLFDYSKSARKEKLLDIIEYRSVIDLRAELTVKKKPPIDFLSRAQVLDLVRKQEIIDHNIERMRNRLAINKASPTPLFKTYMPRTRPSSQQMRWIKGHSNHFEDQIRKQQNDHDRDVINRETNRSASPSSWRKRGAQSSPTKPISLSFDSGGKQI